MVVVGWAPSTLEGVSEWIRAPAVFVIVNSQADLLQVVHALNPSRCLSSRLYGGEQQRDEHRDDRDDDEEFDQSEPSTKAVG